MSSSTAAPTAPTAADDVLPRRDAAEEVVATGRARIDALDAQIVALVQQRADLSHEIQAARRSLGGGRIAHSRELEIVAHYTDSLGRPGTALALALLELCRGRA